ncbi:MAG TPA: M48 family metallopeptidase [Clostridiaceae bacterium]|nr:M48 family metallopeptidase [Clostridiaceae bacterium]
MLLVVDNVEVNVSKKSIKHLHLYVKPPDGRVEVSAPHRIPQNEIEDFIKSKMNWIRKHQNRFAKLSQPQVHKYITGERLDIWGDPYVLEVRYSNKGNFMQICDNRIILTVREKSTTKQRGRYVKEWYRSILKHEIEKLLPRWEQTTGLRSSSWQIKDMKTRWGTCNIETEKLWFNLQLAKKPLICLEYVILHELIHLIERYHNHRFASLMDRYMPNWREVKQILNGS